MAALKAPTAKDYEEGFPTSKQEAIKRGLTRFIGSDGEERVIRNYGSQSFPTGQVQKAKSRAQNRGSESRRATTNEQSLTRQDYLDYAKKNGYSAEQANQLFETNEAKLNEYKAQKKPDLHYEHLSPSRSPIRGGVEHYRNIVMMEGELNLEKSDKLASKTAMREAGVPLTKQGALYADFNDMPLPTDQEQIDIILKDIADQPKPKTTKDVRKALTENPAVEQIGEKFRLIDSLNLTSAQRNQLTRATTLEEKDALLTLFKGKRGALTGLAVAGVTALGPLGTAASAAELQGRSKLAAETKNMMDELQAGLAGASLAGDIASYFPPAAPIGEAVSTAADVANIGIDAYRQNPEKAKQFAKEQLEKATEPLTRPIKNAARLAKDPKAFAENELKYISEQAKRGRLPYTG